MLLCVASSNNTNFARDISRDSPRLCNPQTLYHERQPNDLVMVEETCPMISSTVDISLPPLEKHESSSLDFYEQKGSCYKSPERPKEVDASYRTKVFVVNSLDSHSKLCSDKTETCATTTTFRSSVVNGNRSTNTILVRYKTSNPSSSVGINNDDSDHNQDEALSAKSGSSSASRNSSSKSSKKDKASTSAWAQIMELEGYRSPAVGLDVPNDTHSHESDKLNEFGVLFNSKTSLLNDSCACGANGNANTCICDLNLSTISSDSDKTKSMCNTVHDSHLSNNDCPKLNNFPWNDRKNNFHYFASAHLVNEINNTKISASSAVSNKINSTHQREDNLPESHLHVNYNNSRRDSSYSENDKCQDFSVTRRYVTNNENEEKINQKRTSMIRSESSRSPKMSERKKSSNKSRRKTLPDGNMPVQNSNNVPESGVVSQNSFENCPGHDPNASWGKYNSRAMRESVRKIAEKYALSVYMKRQSRSKLDLLTEEKPVQFTNGNSTNDVQNHSNSFSSPSYCPTNITCESIAADLNQKQNYSDLKSQVKVNSSLFSLPENNRYETHLSHDKSVNLGQEYSFNAFPNTTENVKTYTALRNNQTLTLNEYIDHETGSSKSDLSLISTSQHSSSCSSDSSTKLCSNKINYHPEYIPSSLNNLLQKNVYQNIYSAPVKSTMHSHTQPSKADSVRTSFINVKTYGLQMGHIKPKLCTTCAESTSSGPPSKHSHSRSKLHHSFWDSNKSPSLSKTSLLQTRNTENLSHNGIDSINSHNSHTKVDGCYASSELYSGTNKRTLLSAREMAQLVNGNHSVNNDGIKLPQSGMTNKVTSWIQKQKEKRKPVFAIGDALSLNNEHENTLDNIHETSKLANRKSKRSLSLSSVREEVNYNSRNISDKSDVLLHFAPADHSEKAKNKCNQKSLYVKRASSTCSNRTSARRKTRQGSPAGEERELVAENSSYPRNQVDGCVMSWTGRHHEKVKDDTHECFSNSVVDDAARIDSSVPCLRNAYRDFTSDAKGGKIWSKSAKAYIEQHRSSKTKSSQHDSPGESRNFENRFKANQDLNKQIRHPSFVGNKIERVPPNGPEKLSDLGSIKNERSMLTKKLMNFKQLTRAISLHSLKKKSKETGINCSKFSPEISPTSSFTKWNHDSEEKLEDNKYGSLRKCISYCELSSGTQKAPIKPNLPKSRASLIEGPRNSLAAANKTISSATHCSCLTLRRTVSLFWQFPLSRNTVNAELKSDVLSRICVPRFHERNVFLFQSRKLNRKPRARCSATNTKVDQCAGDTFSMDYHTKQLNSSSWKKMKTQNKTIQDVPTFQEQLLNGNKQPLDERALIMGLGSNHVLDQLNDNTSPNMVEKCPSVENNSTKASQVAQPPVSMSKMKQSSVLRFRNKAFSRSERNAKGRSTSELCGRSARKTLSDTSEMRKRPSSLFYVHNDSDFVAETSNGSNPLHLSGVASGSQPILSAIEELSPTPDGPSPLMKRYVALRTSTPQLSPSDSLLQRLRRSFAVRFQKKKQLISTPSSESCTLPSKESGVVQQITAPVPIEPINKEPPTYKSRPVPDNKGNSSLFAKDLFSNNVDNKFHNRKKKDWRTSLIYDSVDSFFDCSTTTPLNKCHIPAHLAGSDANILRKRAASTSDYSPKSKNIQRPVSVADYLTLENSPSSKVPDHKHDLVKMPSETCHSEDQQKRNLTSLDQIWRANPIKLCRVHSRLMVCRHKGRYRLRRSMSQPVELEMTGSLHNLRDSTHGAYHCSADNENFQKGSLSSDDEASSESDIYHSYCCSPTRRSNACWELSGDGTLYAEALWDHETLDSDELPFQAGDMIEITDTSDQDWWWGSKDGQGGWFPSAFVRMYVSHRPALHFNAQQSDTIEIPYSPCKASMNNLSCEQVRANIVQEIVATERDYVKHLKDVVEGYLKQVQRRPDMFSEERIETVFGNLNEIYTFQSQFLKQLEEHLDKDAPHLSQIGNCFLKHKEEFKMYSQYCNNHPLAVNELQELYCDSQYIHFFEACRLLQEMIDISLDGFLLTPIQRICKYPLQLAELLKFTDTNHPDHVPVTNALAAMKEVAELVNERKRRMECLERIAEWQNTIEGWEGPDVLDASSILIHCGEVTRVSSSWSRDIYLFIFDHQLVYCKKDILKRHTYAYKGRLNLDNCDIVDVEDGKDLQFAINVKNAWKVYCKDKEKWYLFYAKTSLEKDQWLRAFKSERQRVADDKKQAFVVTEEAKKSARLAVQNKQKPKRPRAKFKKGRRCHPDVAVTELLLDSPSAKARSGSLPSNIHPELAIMAGAKLGPTRKKGSGWFHFGSGKKPKS